MLSASTKCASSIRSQLNRLRAAGQQGIKRIRSKGYPAFPAWYNPHLRRAWGADGGGTDGRMGQGASPPRFFCLCRLNGRAIAVSLSNKSNGFVQPTFLGFKQDKTLAGFR